MEDVASEVDFYQLFEAVEVVEGAFDGVVEVFAFDLDVVDLSLE